MAMAASIPGCNGVLSDIAAATCPGSSWVSVGFGCAVESVCLVLAADLTFLVADALDGGVLTTLSALGVGLAVHCQLPLASTQD